MNAKNTSDRMSRPETRVQIPVERAIVQPPPEAVIKCPDCGAARIKGWRVIGGRPGGKHLKQCMGCGRVYEMAADCRTMRQVR